MESNCNPSALFVADCHFHLSPEVPEQKRQERFLQFLATAHEVDHLVLLGDIFDFWFDYPHFRLKGYEEVLQGLDGVKSAGTTIHFVGGNHDIWAADYFHERYDTTGDGQPLNLTLGNTQIRCMHGDGIFGRDWLYKSFRSIVRNPLGIILGKSLHPEVLYKISTRLSGTSRNATRDEAAILLVQAQQWLQSQENAPWDLLIIGHVHHPFQVKYQGKSLAALAGWLDHEGYGLFQDGTFMLKDFNRDP